MAEIHPWETRLPQRPHRGKKLILRQTDGENGAAATRLQGNGAAVVFDRATRDIKTKTVAEFAFRRKKGLKTRPAFSGAIPHPVSATPNRTIPPDARWAEIVMRRSRLSLMAS